MAYILYVLYRIYPVSFYSPDIMIFKESQRLNIFNLIYEKLYLSINDRCDFPIIYLLQCYLCAFIFTMQVPFEGT